MEEFREQIAVLESSANLSASIRDVQKVIDLLKTARAGVAADPERAPSTLSKLQDPLKRSVDAIGKDILPIYKTLGKYSKALDKKFKDIPLPSADNDAISSHPDLINRAIAMHMLREGEFDVASTFIDEAAEHPPEPAPTAGTPEPHVERWEKVLSQNKFDSAELQRQFTKMYAILHELQQNRNIEPAIKWARERSDQLEARGSNLEFELCRLQFTTLFLKYNDEQFVTVDEDYVNDGPLKAWQYARSAFGPFKQRYAREIQHLSGAIAYAPNLYDSPYRRYFYNESAWNDVANSFKKEFCSLLGLSADSPLHIATTAGAVALPTLLKLENVFKRHEHMAWTTQHELPVEIPLPRSYNFHSIFVCPVSKEQATDENPPMMMPCGHVIARESLDQLSKGTRFKCPYCPNESHPRDAVQVVL